MPTFTPTHNPTNSTTNCFQCTDKGAMEIGYRVWCPLNALNPGGPGICYNAYNGAMPDVCKSQQHAWVTEACGCTTTSAPTVAPTDSPTAAPTINPTALPTTLPTGYPTASPTVITCNRCTPVDNSCAKSCAHFQQVEVKVTFAAALTPTKYTALYDQLAPPTAGNPHGGFEPYYFIRVAHTGVDNRPMQLNLATLFTVLGTTDSTALPMASIKANVVTWLRANDASIDQFTVVDIKFSNIDPAYMRRRLSSSFVQQYSNDHHHQRRLVVATDAPTSAPTNSPTLAPTSARLACHVSIAREGAAASGVTLNALSSADSGSLAIAVKATLTSASLSYDVEGQAITSTVEQAGFVHPTPSPTPSPTTTPTTGVQPTNQPTKMPTTFPTGWPTLAAAVNPPLPEYVASQFTYLNTASVVASLDGLTSPPTLAPTNPPTLPGYAVVQQEVAVSVISVPFVFAVTPDEAKTSLMQAVLAGGIAAALGLDASMVVITEVGGDASKRRLGSGRNLAASTTITSEIESASSDANQISALKTSITTAASTGAITRNVQKTAHASGALTASLRDMEPVQAVPVFTDKTVTKTKAVIVRANTNAPTGNAVTPDTPIPTPKPTMAPTFAPSKAPTVQIPAKNRGIYNDDFLSAGEMVAILVFSVTFVAAILAKIYCVCTSSSSQDMSKVTKSQMEAKPVSGSQLEIQLAVSEVDA
jgi:hypothetical protein